MVPAVAKPLRVAVALPVASSVAVPARRVPAQNSTLPVGDRLAGAEDRGRGPGRLTGLDAVGLIESATSLRSDAPVTTTVLVAATGLAPGSSVVWTASFTSFWRSWASASTVTW